ncbi:long-chain-fatty-acid--CoA ligase heimdall [Teleopsis dalmanni]|uniref:long-chain-fatty-acid--CoA ligase heimdall n=1 Tax=Teleopsis dalmanni TaxID=139649 RepID=UPI000D32C814|nr:long-chain-fatty-acid--CoA ligase heimdall [Teleopsis dalmanni]XP_037958362.1 long-chain-fatty-acid--CoA ligase heimdall [Teleopsis dalmanni]
MGDTIDMSSLSSIKAATSYTSNSLHEAIKLRLGKQGLSAIKPQTIPQFFREGCQKYATYPALVYELDPDLNATANAHPHPQTTEGVWRTVTYAEYAKQVEQAALILLHVGLQPRSSVGILAFNCPEWFYTEFGTLRAGGVVAGIYPSNSAEAVYHVLDTSEATVCVVDDTQQMAKVRAIKSRLPRLRAVLQLHGPYEDFVGVDEGYYRWEDLLLMQFGAELKEELERRERDVGANECALLIYTSGTVGMPKAVMVSHDAIVYDTKAITKILPDIKEGAETVVTYLPLNHIAAQIFDIYLPLYNNGCVYFADRGALKGTLGRTLAKAKPTRFFGVPRIFEKMQEKLVSIEVNLSAITKYIVRFARQNVEQYHMCIYERKTPSHFKYWYSSKITGHIKSALGLDNCKSLIIGGAPVREELKKYFLSLDMVLIDVYGLSETSGAIAFSFDQTNLKSVGKAIDCVEMKICNPDNNGHGEVCLRGRTNFMGYLNDVQNTKDVLKEDGWLHTGDIGYIDTQGNLIISGRIKELIITAGGENIPPIHIEELIKRELHIISNAMVVGDHKKYLTVLLTLKTEFDNNTGRPTDILTKEAIDWLKSFNLELTRLSEVLEIPTDISDLDASNVEVKPHPIVMKAIEEGIQRANKHSISNAQKVQKFSILPHDFSTPTGELGPTLKMRRNIVLQKYANIIEGMYK